MIVSNLLEPLPIFIGDPVAAYAPVSGLYDAAGIHPCGSIPRFLWPSYEPDDFVASAISSIPSRPIWIEVGFGPASPLAYAKGVHLLHLIDSRMWACRMMRFSHSEKTWDLYAQLRDNIGFCEKHLCIMDLRRKARDVSTWQQAAIALFLAHRSCGKTLRYKNIQASIEIGKRSEKRPYLTAPNRMKIAIGSLQAHHETMDALRICVKVLRKTANMVHIHINEHVPTNLLVDTLLSLTNIGFSWSISVDDPAQFFDVKRMGKNHIEWNDFVFATGFGNNVASAGN